MPSDERPNISILARSIILQENHGKFSEPLLPSSMDFRLKIVTESGMEIVYLYANGLTTPCSSMKSKEKLEELKAIIECGYTNDQSIFMYYGIDQSSPYSFKFSSVCKNIVE
jgi:hypothetical protein